MCLQSEVRGIRYRDTVPNIRGEDRVSCISKPWNWVSANCPCRSRDHQVLDERKLRNLACPVSMPRSRKYALASSAKHQHHHHHLLLPYLCQKPCRVRNCYLRSSWQLTGSTFLRAVNKLDTTGYSRSAFPRLQTHPFFDHYHCLSRPSLPVACIRRASSHVCPGI